MPAVSSTNSLVGVQPNDLVGFTITTLTNGNYIIGNCHAGEGQPLLIELEPKTKKVVWTFDRFKDFGNDVSNSQTLDAEAVR